MTRRWIQLILLAGATIGWACDVNPLSHEDDHRGPRLEAREFFSFEQNAVNHTSLTLNAINGGVTINGSAEASSVVISGERRVGSGTLADAQAQLPNLEVRVSDLGSQILVETIQPGDSQGYNYTVEYTITVPRDFNVRVNNLNGGVGIRGINGSAFVDLLNGAIDARVGLPVNGTIDLTTLNGVIQLDIPEQTSAELSASVTNGAITISNLVLRGEVSTPRSLRGTLGDGRGLISLRTTNGVIGIVGF